MKRPARYRAKTRTYNAWTALKGRCFNPRNKAFKHYGGRGIKVCVRWMSYFNFYDDMGPVPRGFSIERVDVNGDYCPENCKWIPRREQPLNLRTTRKFTFQGESLPLSVWSKRLGVPKSALKARFQKGIPARRALDPNFKRLPSPIAARRRKNRWCLRGHLYDMAVFHPDGRLKFRYCLACKKADDRAYYLRNKGLFAA